MSELTWSDLFERGAIIDLNTSKWGAKIKSKLSDFGIDETDEVRAAITVGSHLLAPKKAMDRIDGLVRAARETIDQNSLNFAMIRGARYIPDNRLEEVISKLRDLKTRFNAEVAGFMATFKQMSETQLETIRVAMITAAHSPEAADVAYQRIKLSYPSYQDVFASFAMTWSIYTLSSPKTGAAAKAAQEEAENVKSIVRDMVTQLRGEFTERLDAIIETAKRGVKIDKRTIEKTYAVIERIEALNITADSVLTEQVNLVKRLLETVAGDKAEDSLITSLDASNKVLNESIEQAIAEAEAGLTGIGRRRFAKE